MCSAGSGNNRGRGEIIRRTTEHLWIAYFINDVYADFLAIYHLPNWDELDGPRFISLASRLPFYTGAVQGRLKLENGDDDNPYSDESREYSVSPGTSIPMSQFAEGATKFDALNEESERAGGGRLFEVVTT